jgi:hypothetical protein
VACGTPNHTPPIYAYCIGTKAGSFTIYANSTYNQTNPSPYNQRIPFTFNVYSPPNTLGVTPATATVPLGVTQKYTGIGVTSDGTQLPDNITATPPANVTCTQEAAHPSIDDCSATVAGTYIITFTDTYGNTTTAALVGSAAGATGVGNTPPSCSWPAQNADLATVGNDLQALACYLGQMVNYIFNLPGNIAVFFFGDGTGSGVNFLILTQQLIPSGACRTGQAPTAPDGVNCVSFPFSIPFDVYNIYNFFNVTPVVPDLGGQMTFTFGNITIHPTMSLNLGTYGDAHIGGIFGNTSVMDIFKAGEVLSLIISLGWATGKVLNVFGIA